MKPNAESADPSASRSAGQLRKSKPRRADWAAGNGAKFLSYGEAWTRIREAGRKGFFLEAVTLQESILSDRLTSFLVKSCGLDPRSKLFRGFNDLVRSRGFDQGDRSPRTFRKLVGAWAKTERAEAKFGAQLLQQLEELQQRIEPWRIARNDVVRGLVKSRARRGDDHIEGLRSRAHQSAREGHVLARATSNWVDAARIEITEASKAGDRS